MASAPHADRLLAGRCVFSRILVGIDGSRHALEAARQAALLLDVGGSLTFFSAWDVRPTAPRRAGGGMPSQAGHELRRDTAEAALLAACEHVAPYVAATAKTAPGAALAGLLYEAERGGDTLIAVGSKGAGCLPGAAEDDIPGAILRRSPCSVLVTRTADGDFPRLVAVGVDGSVGSRAAYGAARYVAERFGSEFLVLAASGGDPLDPRLVEAITGGEHHESREGATEALTRAARDADLVVVGAHGLHRRVPLGSVSERVASSTTCSTLVVREPTLQRFGGTLPPL